MRAEHSNRYEFILNPDDPQQRWLIEQLDRAGTKSDVIRAALVDWFDPPALQQVNSLNETVAEQRQLIDELRAHVAYLEGVIDALRKFET